jgi:hypothetical protein
MLEVSCRSVGVGDMQYEVVRALCLAAEAAVSCCVRDAVAFRTEPVAF